LDDRRRVGGVTGGTSGVLPVTVVLPTIGRPDLVRSCLASLAACDPRADEILVVDSSTDDAVERVVAEVGLEGARTIRANRLGLGYAFNVGLAEARNELVLLTNDDCTVDSSWVGVGQAQAARDARALVSGRVLPLGDPEAVPSTIDSPTPRVYCGKPAFVLYTQCLALHRSTVLELGGFDGRISPSAEDNDLSYRWLRAGRTIRYEPTFVVWHHDWRTRDQLQRLYVGYGVGQGMVYGKHLRQGDLAIARYLLRDVYAGFRGLVARVVRRSSSSVDWRMGLVRGLPVGLLRGWRAVGGREAGTTAP
jgi:GT2 family glycosyltransferase